VAGIFDFGLANRTYPVHDLAPLLGFMKGHLGG
jgi:hypothetical protein